MNDLLKCPKCGGEMEGGYLDIRAGGAFSVLFANEKPSFWDFNGDKLFDSWRGEKAIAAHRCRNCRVVLFEYPDVSKKVSSHE